MQKISIFAINGGLWDDFITIYWKMLHDIAVAMGELMLYFCIFLASFLRLSRNLIMKKDNDEVGLQK
jgi:hypothetical protein